MRNSYKNKYVKLFGEAVQKLNEEATVRQLETLYLPGGQAVIEFINKPDGTVLVREKEEPAAENGYTGYNPYGDETMPFEKALEYWFELKARGYIEQFKEAAGSETINKKDNDKDLTLRCPVYGLLNDEEPQDFYTVIGKKYYKIEEGPNPENVWSDKEDHPQDYIVPVDSIPEGLKIIGVAYINKHNGDVVDYEFY